MRTIMIMITITPLGLDHTPPTASTTHPGPAFEDPAAAATPPSSPYPKGVPATSHSVNFVERGCSSDFEKTRPQPSPPTFPWPPHWHLPPHLALQTALQPPPQAAPQATPQAISQATSCSLSCNGTRIPTYVDVRTYVNSPSVYPVTSIPLVA